MNQCKMCLRYFSLQNELNNHSDICNGIPYYIWFKMNQEQKETIYRNGGIK